MFQNIKQSKKKRNIEIHGQNAKNENINNQEQNSEKNENFLKKKKRNKLFYFEQTNKQTKPSIIIKFY